MSPESSGAGIQQEPEKRKRKKKKKKSILTRSSCQQGIGRAHENHYQPPDRPDGGGAAAHSAAIKGRRPFKNQEQVAACAANGHEAARVPRSPSRSPASLLLSLPPSICSSLFQLHSSSSLLVLLPCFPSFLTFSAFFSIAFGWGRGNYSRAREL